MRPGYITLNWKLHVDLDDPTQVDAAKRMLSHNIQVEVETHEHPVPFYNKFTEVELGLDSCSIDPRDYTPTPGVCFLCGIASEPEDNEEQQFAGSICPPCKMDIDNAVPD